MNSFLNYLIEANLALVLILAMYLLFLRNETSFRFIRMFLLTGIAGALLFPLFHIETGAASSPLSIGNVIPFYWLPEVAVGADAPNETLTAPLDAWRYVAFIYAGGVAFFALLTLVEIFKLVGTIRKAQTYRLANLHIAESIEDKPTFSFFNFIFIGKAHELSTEEKQQIIHHEGIHAKEWHSFDILLVNVLTTFFWFNPFLCLYKKTFIQLHEFEADARAVNESGVDKYCSLLAKVALQSAGFRLVNHFNNSLTVKRIEMMRTIKTNIQRWRLVAIALTLPLVFFFVACQDQVGDDIMEITQNSTHALIVPEQVQQAFEGVQQAYPERKYVLLALNETATKKIDGLKNQYGLPNSITVLKTSNGEIVEASQNRTQDASMLKQHTIDETGDLQTFAIIEFSDEASRIAEASQEDKIYTVVEQQPEFSGGYDAMMTFIKQNMRYPANARQQGIEGTVFVSFIVGADGSVTDAKVIRGISQECDEEARRVVESFPNWIPGKQSGEPVSVRFVLPLKYKLNQETAPPEK